VKKIDTLREKKNGYLGKGKIANRAMKNWRRFLQEGRQFA